MDAIRKPDNTSGKEVKTVLIIEDEPALLELLTKTLLLQGFQVLPASNGAKGIEFATSSHPDVIILDLTMPEQTGFKSSKNFARAPAHKNIPILDPHRHRAE